jgi:hypothetical protein
MEVRHGGLRINTGTSQLLIQILRIFFLTLGWQNLYLDPDSNSPESLNQVPDPYSIE